MHRPAENYVPQRFSAALRQQAWRAWALGFSLVLVWLLLILAPPIAKAYGLEALSGPLYGFFGYLCHQIPSRSFFIAGEKLGVCSRCFGVYAGLVLGFVIYPVWRRIDDIEPFSKIWLFLSLIPITIDWSLTVFGIWENTHLSRFLTGLILGVACGSYIVPAIIEIARNLALRRRTFVDSRS